MKRTSIFPKPDREKLLLAKDLHANEVRLVVANYQAEQDARKRADMQLRHLGDRQPNPFLTVTADLHAEWENLLFGCGRGGVIHDTHDPSRGGTRCVK